MTEKRKTEEQNKHQMLAYIEETGPQRLMDIRAAMNWAKDRTERTLQALVACGAVKSSKGLYASTGLGIPERVRREPMKVEQYQPPKWEPARDGAEDHKAIKRRGIG